MKVKRITMMRAMTGLTAVMMFVLYRNNDITAENGISWLRSQPQGQPGDRFLATRTLETTTTTTTSITENEKFELREDGTLFVPVSGERLERVEPNTERRMCTLLTERAEDVKRVHVHNSLCGDDSLGNYIIHLYSWHLLAHLASKPFTFTCADTAGNNNGGVMALTQIQEKLADLTPLEDMEHYTVQEYCAIQSKGQFWKSKVGGFEHAHAIISKGMEIVAQSKAGQSFPADDAVIHLRLHDALKPTPKVGSQRGLFQHSTYAKLLKQAQEEQKQPIKSISLVTAPFEEDGVRVKDLEFLERSKMIALDLQDYLKRQFPLATVTIHNSMEETPVTAYARLIRAKMVAVCGCSTFCPLPVFGVQPHVKGYVYESPHYSFFNTYFAQMLDNIETWDEPMLGNGDIPDLTDAQLLQWLHDTPTAKIE